MKYCSKKLITLVKDNAIQRLYSSSIPVQDISLYLKDRLLEQRYILIQSVTNKSGEKEFLAKKKQLISKFNNLCNKYSRRSN